MEKKLFKKKTALIMKMTFLFILLGFLQVNAKVQPGTNGSPELLMANAGIKVTGTVISKTDGQAIPGVNVVVKGTTVGMITSSNGTFTIEVPNSNSVLVFSFVGFIPQEVKLDGKTQLNVALEEENLNVEQVVVVGYGTIKKKDVTGSVSSVSNAKLMEKASFSAAQALQGKAAGVVVQQKSSAPGSDPTVMIRGNRSITAGSAPLYVVDGIPLVIGLSEISQSDIETIDILKDASATAIYGARGANGVVLITTKKGKEGRAVIDVNSYYGVQTPAKSVALFNGPEWVEFIREAYRKSGKLPAVPTFDTDKLMMPVGQENDPTGIAFKIQSAYDPDGSWHPERLQSTDWLGEVTRTGTITNHEVSVRGGTEKLKVMASATYFNQKGLVKTQDYSRYSARVNFDWNLTDNVTIGGQTQFSHFDRNDGPNVYDGIKSLSPLANISNADGVMFNRPGNDPQLWNPVLNINNAIVRYRKDRFMGSYYVEVKLPFDIKFRSNAGLDVGPYYDQRFYGTLSSDRQGGLARAENGSDTRTMFTWENLLYWNKIIKKHTFGVTLLQSIQEEKRETARISVTDLPYETQLWYNVGSSPKPAGVTSTYTKWQLASFMGRLNYSFNDRYLLTASLRDDGSSRLAEGHQWVLFPAAAIAWRASEESFMQNVNVLSALKFRAGYGVTASTDIDPYKTGGSLTYSRYNFGSNNVMAFYQSEMPNPNLGWETTKAWNAGVDFGLFKGRINGVVDVYLQNTSHILLQRQLPQVSGFSSVLSNVGKTRNKGIEITINAQNIKKKDFTWSTDFIFARNKEEIVDLYGNSKDDIGNGWFIGQPINVFYDYKSLGIWQLGEEAEMAKYTSSSFKPGDIKVQDTNGDYKITEADRVIIGTPRPTFTANIANYINYKDFDFNFSLNGSYGNMLNYDRGLSFNGRYNSVKVNYWKATAYDASGNVTASNGSNEAPRPNNGVENPPFRNSLNYFEASFLRLSDVTLGYTLPKNLIKKVGVTKLRMYVTVQNGFCWTKFPGTDPESGTDFNVPTPRTFMVGINMSL